MYTFMPAHIHFGERKDVKDGREKALDSLLVRAI